VTSAAIRRAEPADLAAIRDLLSLRDERTWDEAATVRTFFGLAPDRCVAWIAHAGTQLVGLSTLFVRDLEGPAGTLRAGYWANLFIDPAYRTLMLYPRLPLAMFAAAPSLGLRVIYGSVRRQGLAEAHTRIGFARLGRLNVLVKPLRPLRLLARYRRWPLGRAAVLPDALYRGWLSASRPRATAGMTLEERAPGEVDAACLTDLIRASAAGRVLARWTPEFFAERYARTPEGGTYRVVTAHRGADLLGAVIHCIAERGEGIRAGVVMDVIATPGAEADMAAALGLVEERALEADADLMLFLDGLGPDLARVLSSCGYRRSPEVYDMLLWPARDIAAGAPLAPLSDAARWRFCFGDHDAF
jgi:hypothetical protein